MRFSLHKSLDFYDSYVVNNTTSEIFLCPKHFFYDNIFWELCTYSCPLVQYFGTLFWDDITIFWDENYVNKLLSGPKQVFSSQLKIITNFHPKITSQIIVLKGREQV